MQLFKFRLRASSLVGLLVALSFLAACGGTPKKTPAPAATPPTAFIIRTLSPAYTLPAAIQNVPYAFGIQSNADDSTTGAHLPVTFGLTGSNPLPPGMQLDPAGLIHGTPSQPGVFLFTIRAVDSSPTPLTSNPVTFAITVRLPGAVLTQIGQNNLGGQGQNADVTVHGHLAFVGTRGSAGSCPASGVKIVDLTQPTSPQLIATISGTTGTSQEEAKVETVSTPQFHAGGSGDLLAVAVQPCAPGASGAAHGGIALYDVSSPGNPVSLGFWDATSGGSGSQAGTYGVRDVAIVPVLNSATPSSNRVFILTSVPNGEIAGKSDTQDDLRIIEVTDPANPRQIGSWGVFTALAIDPATVKLGQDQRVFLDTIHLTDDKKTAFLAYWDEGVVELNVSDPTVVSNANSNIVLSHVIYPTNSVATTTAPSSPEGNTHAAVPVNGSSGLLVADEVCPSTPGTANPSSTVVCGFNVDLTPTNGAGFLRAYSLPAVNTPAAQGVLFTPQSESNPAPDRGIYSAHNIAWNGDTQNPHAYIAWFSNGILDASLASLNPPALLSGFVPPDSADPQGSNPALNNPSKALVYGVAAYSDSNGRYVVATDINSGLIIVRETAAPAFSVITSSLPDGTVSVPYAVQLQSINGTPGFNGILWTLAAGSLPGGLTLDTQGALTGTPLATGTATFTVRATDGSGVQVLQPLTLTINSNFTIVPRTLPLATLNEAYSQTLTAVNGTGAVTWTLNSGALPAGMQLSSAGVLSGTPTAKGTFNFVVGAADTSTPTAHADARAFTLQVSPLTFSTPAALPDGAVNQAYSQALVTANGTAPFTFTLATGSSLPAGLTLSTAGVITGTPSTAGASTFTIQVADASNQTASQVFTLKIDSFAIATTTLPDGKVGQGYSQTLQVKNGVAPFTFAVTAGALPAGLTLSGSGASAGLISGVPTAAGASTFTVQATDAKNSTSTQNYTINVAP
ncbi:MAG: putative Ig domain-containing protein [Terriglobales bacterium]